MDSQLDLFANRIPPPVVAFCSSTSEAADLSGKQDLIDESSPTGMSREQAPREEVEFPGLSIPRLTTTHGALFQADCLEFLSAIRSESIDSIFADPPFNLKKEYRNGFTDHWTDS